ncbi:MAG: hypothetical protein KDC42_05250 [Ignavibacteriae bacterium]|nr:hypothetical protein [Ignavibacteriota bacterium]
MDHDPLLMEALYEGITGINGSRPVFFRPHGQGRQGNLTVMSLGSSNGITPAPPRRMYTGGVGPLRLNSRMMACNGVLHEKVRSIVVALHDMLARHSGKPIVHCLKSG